MKPVFILLLFLLPFLASAQCSIEEYKTLLNEAKTAQKKGQYDLAINKLFSARVCRPEKDEEIKGKILEVFKEVNNQRVLAVKNAEEAKQQRQIAENQRDSTERLRQVAEEERLKAQKLARSSMNSALIAAARDTNPTFALNAAYYNWQTHPDLVNAGIDFIKIYNDTIHSFYQNCWNTNADQTIRILSNGKNLFSTRSNGMYYIWDNETKKAIRTLNLPDRDFKLIIISPNSRFLLITTVHKAYLWDTQQEKGEAKELPIFIPVGGSRATISNDGKLLAVSGMTGTIDIYTTQPFRRIKELNGHFLEVYSLMFSNDGTLLLTGGSDNSCILWDTNSGKPIRSFLGHSKAVGCVSFSPNEQQIATESDDNTTRIWNIENGNCIHVLPGKGQSEGIMKYFGILKYSLDGKLLLTTEVDGSAVIWNLQNGQIYRRLLGHAGPITSVDFSVDVKSVWTFGIDGTIRTWELAPNAPTNKYTAKDATYSPDGTQIAVGKFDGKVEIRSLPSDSLIRAINVYNVSPLAFSPDNIKIWIGRSMWSVQSGKEAQGFLTGQINYAKFSPNGKILAVGGHEEKPKFFDVTSGKLIRQLSNQGTHSIRFSSDGNLLLFGNSGTCKGSRVSIWDFTKDTITSVIRANGNLCSADVSLDGKFVAVGAENGDIQLWERETGTLIKEFATGYDEFELPLRNVPADFMANDKWIHDICFSPNGNNLVSVGLTGRPKVWNIKSEQILQILPGKFNRTKVSEYSPDGSTIMTISDSTVTLYPTCEWVYKNRIFQFKQEELRNNGLQLEPEHLLQIRAKGIRLRDEELRSSSGWRN